MIHLLLIDSPNQIGEVWAEKIPLPDQQQILCFFNNTRTASSIDLSLLKAI